MRRASHMIIWHGRRACKARPVGGVCLTIRSVGSLERSVSYDLRMAKKSKSKNGYVDGFVLVIPTKKMAAYKR